MLRKFMNRSFVTSTLVLLVAIFLALNVFMTTVVRDAQIDLTEDRLYTLSEGTHNLMKSIQEPITLKLYYSEKEAVDIPQVRVLAERVKDMLGAFSRISDGMVRVEIIEPEPYTEAEDEAEAAGLTAAPLASGEVVYFGLVGTNAIDGQEIIAFFAPEREARLEYDLASLVDRLNRERAPVLGLLTDLPLSSGPGGMMAAMQGRSQPFVMYEQLLGNFELQELGPELTSIPEDVDVLMLVHPPALSDTALYAIDQFVMGGGRIIAFLDPFSEMSQVNGPGGEAYTFSSAASLGPLMEAWGVTMDGSKVVADRQRALRVGFGANMPPMDYVLWLGFDNRDMDGDDLVTANLNYLQMASVGALEPLEGATTRFIPLLKSSRDAMLVDFQEAQFQTPPDELLRSYKSSGQSYVIGARLTGAVKTAFPDGPPPLDADAQVEPDAEPLSDPIAATDNANILIIADSDLFNDQFWVQVSDFLGERLMQETSDNGSLVLGAAENMMGSNDLVSLRSRAPVKRDFTRVEDLRREAEARFLPQSQALDDKLDQIVQRVDEIRGSGMGESDDGTLLVTPEQRAELQRLLLEADTTRKAQRDIQYELGADIDRLGAWIKFFNIAFVPLLVAGFAIFLAFRRRRQMRMQGTQGGAIHV
ncbi:MAG: ABC transporter [Alphaproteobacteria bacterium]|nr:MAG: ABC transporter [Alphaproteobacteria bacterium]